MTPHRTIGIRELRNGLNRYVTEVEDGTEIVITIRGKPVARLSPVDRADGLDELRKRGLINEPTRRPRRAVGRKGIQVEGTISDLIREQRR